MTQETALSILKTGANVFLTGEPGSGKTHTINRYIAYLRGCGITPSITASTGIAATHIGGMTIHSWSGIGIRASLSPYDLEAIAQKEHVVRRVRNATTLIIDEISMLSGETLSMVDAVCKTIRGSREPFGGLQTILVGDFFQLPPISRTPRFMLRQGTLMDERADNPFAFASPAWRALKPVVCYLSEQHRQEDAAFLEVLAAIRCGGVTEAHRTLLATREGAQPPLGATRLFSHNVDVDRVNDDELGRLPGTPRVYVAKRKGAPMLADQIIKGCLSPETLRLKLGARVMFTKNDPERRFVNGTLGAVTAFERDGAPLVRTHTGAMIAADPTEWRMQDGDKVLASITQVPLRLAWAITVHKSQGMSLDAAHMDLSKAFEYGQGYVALSRVRTLEGLSLAGINERALQSHPEIQTCDDAFRAQAQEAHDAFAIMAEADLAEMHRNFIRACGGYIPTGDPEKAAPQKKVKREIWRDTADLIQKGAQIEEIADTIERTATTVLKHIELAIEAGALAHDDIAHIADHIADTDLMEADAAFRRLGTERLKPVFDDLRERVPYETLHIVRLLVCAAACKK